MSEEGRVEFANQAICDYFDLNESPGDLKGLTSSDVLAKIKVAYTDPDEAIARILEIVDQGKVVKSEEVPMRNGRVVLRDFIPVQVNGKPYGRLWYHIDITERKRAEEELARTNEKVDHVLRSIQDDFYVLDRDWNFVFASRNFTSRIGKEPKDFLGRNMWEMFPNHIGTVIDENFRATMENRETRRFELPASTRTPGTAWPLSLPLRESQSSERILLTASRWKKNCVKRLRLPDGMKKHLQVLTENVRSGVALIDDSGRFSVVNRAFLQMFGLESESAF